MGVDIESRLVRIGVVDFDVFQNVLVLFDHLQTTQQLAKMVNNSRSRIPRHSRRLGQWTGNGNTTGLGRICRWIDRAQPCAHHSCNGRSRVWCVAPWWDLASTWCIHDRLLCSKVPLCYRWYPHATHITGCNHTCKHVVTWIRTSCANTWIKSWFTHESRSLTTSHQFLFNSITDFLSISPRSEAIRLYTKLFGW